MTTRQNLFFFGFGATRRGEKKGPGEDETQLKPHVPSSSLTSLAIICFTHCSLMIASLASVTLWLSRKSTPEKVGGTVGFLARKASDSGVGIVIALIGVYMAREVGRWEVRGWGEKAASS